MAGALQIRESEMKEIPNYDPASIEPKWQKVWEEEKPYAAVDCDKTREPVYVLDMFPYPSGAGLHVGHPEGYTATDIYSRFKRMQGFNVLLEVAVALAHEDLAVPVAFLYIGPGLVAFLLAAHGDTELINDGI